MSDVPASPAARLAIVIVTYNRSTYLADLLRSATALTVPPWRIVVVDNASTDDTPDVVAEAAGWFPEGVLVDRRLDTNTGGSGGFCEGTRTALELGAEWVWLMDDDVEILPEALERFAPAMERFRVIHGRRYDFDGSPFYWQAKFNQFLGVPLPYGFRRTFDDEGYAITNSGTFEGMLIHADVVRTIGLPDPRFFITWDDAAYAWLAAQHTEVVYMDAFVLQRKREQQQVNLGVRHLNDGSPLFRFHVMRNRAYVGRYFAEHGQLHRVGFALGTLLTFAKEVFRLVVVQHTLHGVGDLVRGARASRRIWRDRTWPIPTGRCMPPLPWATRQRNGPCPTWRAATRCAALRNAAKVWGSRYDPACGPPRADYRRRLGAGRGPGAALCRSGGRGLDRRAPPRAPASHRRAPSEHPHRHRRHHR